MTFQDGDRVRGVLGNSYTRTGGQWWSTVGAVPLSDETIAWMLQFKSKVTTVHTTNKISKSDTTQVFVDEYRWWLE